jgi:2',3'-cyclic-nucleotide 2'-phosphodiesterase (5'-nucleotidase family)
MKRIAASIVLIFAVVSMIVLVYLARKQPAPTPSQEITIVYQADRRGVIHPNTCSLAPYGGTGREVNAALAWRDAAEDAKRTFLYIDNGNSLARDFIENPTSEDKDKAAWILARLGEAKLDVLAVGAAEYSFDTELLKEAEREFGISLVSTNVTTKDGESLFDRFVVVEVDGFKFVLISLVSPDELKSDRFVVQDPRAALNEILPSLKSQGDMIILLSQLGVKENEILAEEYAGQISILLSGDLNFSTGTIFWFGAGQTIMLNQFTSGFYLGKIDINYITPFEGFYSPEAVQDNLNRIAELEQALATRTDPAQRESIENRINVIRTQRLISEIDGGSRYSGDAFPLNSQFD